MSSSLLFQMLLKMDAGQAKAELQAFTTLTSKAGKEVGDLPAKARPATTAIEDMGRAFADSGEASEQSAKLTAAAALAASRAELLRLQSTDGAAQKDIEAARAAYNKAKALDATATAALAASRAQTQAAGTVQTMGRSHQAAAGSVGNLIAQFNDIGMMIAAGQNPLQLAIQQGTQITQVIGPMGASGAVKALGSALLGMLNPINFVTFGVIAGGAALAQWAMSGEEAAGTLEEAMDGLGESIDKYTGYIRTAATDTSELTAQFGRFAGQIKGFSEYLAGVALGQSMEELRATLVPLEGALGGFEQSLRNIEMAQRAVASEQALLNQGFGNPEAVLRAQEAVEMFRDAAESTAGQLGLTTDQAAEFARLLDVLGEAKSMENIATAAGNALRYLEQTTPAGEDLSGAMAAAAFALGEMQAKAAEALKETVALSNSAPGAGWMGTAIGETNLLIGRLIEARNQQSALANVSMRLQADGQVYSGRGGDPRKFMNQPYARRFGTDSIDDLIVSFQKKSAGTGSDGRSGAGAEAASKEADTVAKLIEKLQAELDVSRELDPVQREMAKYREQLAKATDAESAKVRELIRLREEEKEKTEMLEYVQAQTGNALIDGLMGAADAGERLIDTLTRATLQAILLGEGPLARLFGGGKGGGLLGPVFGAITGGIMGKADGGMIFGAGGPRDDKVPIMASPGEFMVNARATARHRGLLEQINSGALSSVPAFANGGAIGGGGQAGASSGASGGTVFNAYFDLSHAQGEESIRAAAKEGMQEALKMFARAELPGHVRRISSDPSVVRF
jgi:hypothetical protein